MGFWIEIRCDVFSDKNGTRYERCLSADNEGPQGMAGDSLRSVTEMTRYLVAQAKRQGWKKGASGWVCPFCVSIRNTNERQG